MDKLNRERTQLRRSFTKAVNEAKCLLEKEEKQRIDVRKILDTLEDKASRMFKIDEEIKEMYLVDDAFDEDTFGKEFDSAESYRNNWISIKNDCEDILNKFLPNDIDQVSVSNNSFSMKRHFRLPKIELKQFDGNIRNWLSFWGQFRKIDDDSNIDDDDKFQYLYQSTVPGSSARELIESFPPCGENYGKAIEQLKARFARDELLIEIYVRELLNLVFSRTDNHNITLRALYDKIETHLRALETLGVTSDKYAAMLYPLVESALPDEILQVWERIRHTKGQSEAETNNLTHLLSFLKLEVEGEERLSIARSSFGNEEVSKSFSNSEKGKLSTAACIYSGEEKRSNQCCIWCEKKNHNSQDCYQVKEFDREKKIDILKRKGACFRCLKKGHSSKNCKSKIKCLLCNYSHHVVMCSRLKDTNKDIKGPKLDELATKVVCIDKETETLTAQERNGTLLQTLIVKVKSKNNSYKLARLLLDSGSQRSYITKDGVAKLDLEKICQETLSHSLFGGTKTKLQEHGVYDVTLLSCDEKFEIKVTMLDQERICNFVPKLSKEHLSLLELGNVRLSDADHDIPDVKILLGADVMGKLLTGNIKKLEEDLFAMETKLGWTVMGKTKSRNGHDVASTLCCLNGISIPDLWSLEAIGIKDPADIKSKEESEKEVVDFFEKTICVNDEGRYEVRLPFKTGCPALENNKEVATKRLFNTTRHLKNAEKYEDYCQVFEEWLKEGIIENIPDEQESKGYYLPHRAVIKESSLTTKIRPVFDASVNDEKGNSLNNCLEKGPNLIEKIPEKLIQFREHAIAVTADIKKAFLQISLDQTDRDYLKFFWWKDGKQITYRHCRVVFGVTSSPFLLGATINYHLKNVPDSFRSTANKLARSFYVDNVVTSVKSPEELQKFVHEAQEIMLLGKFELRGWVSGPETIADTAEATIPILGLLWDTSKDEIYCDINLESILSTPLTRRTLLSVSQSVFDPIGILSPSTVLPKLLIQESWKEKHTWDEELPKIIADKFEEWLRQVCWLKNCRIPRKLILISANPSSYSIHIFCDASASAYASCIFVRTSKDNDVSVQLVLSKVRITPIKAISIPRLELLAATMGVRLFLTVKEALEFQNYDTYFWSDSAVALTWIKRDDDWNTFVANRCKEIRKYTNPENWHHIAGVLNPADLPSRGCYPKTLAKGEWWKGPSWLKLEEKDWPKSKVLVPEEDVNKEKKKTAVVQLSCEEQNFTSELLYFSQYMKIVRMISWIQRFVSNSLPCKGKIKGELTFEEVQDAEGKLLRCIQKECFQSEGAKSLEKMQTFKDEKGLIRIRTKLVHGEETNEFKFPIVLPGKHTIVRRMIYHEHCLLQHAGLGILITNLRERFWIIGVRRVTKSVISQCVICRRYKSNPVEPPFAPLPLDRIKNAAVFEVTGIDLAGPLILLTGEKCWIVLFTCAVYRAVHFELVKSLSTESFIMALRRFVARRGRVSIIYSDNGTNFEGASNALKTVNWNEVMTFSTVQKIKWNFNPPSAPWWGGWWERSSRRNKSAHSGETTSDVAELAPR